MSSVIELRSIKYLQSNGVGKASPPPVLVERVKGMAENNGRIIGISQEHLWVAVYQMEKL